MERSARAGVFPHASSLVALSLRPCKTPFRAAGAAPVTDRVTRSVSKADRTMSNFTLEEIATFAGVPPSPLLRANAKHTMPCADHLPQARAQRRWPLIAVVITEPLETLFGDPALAGVLADITAACNAQSCLCSLVLNTGTDLPPVIRPPHILGVIVVGHQADRLTAQLRERRLPLLGFDRQPPAGLSTAVTQLIQLGRYHLERNA